MMDPRNVADLLYESEATLRLVDTALDEIRAGESNADLSLLGSRRNEIGVARTEHRPYDAPSEFRVRAFWQVQEVADCVRESRELLRTVGEAGPGDIRLDERAGFDRILSLIDRLDPASDPGNAGTRERLFAELRAEVLALIGSTEASIEGSRNITLAISFLSEAEGRLTQLRHILDASG